MKSDEELGLLWAGGQMEKRDLWDLLFSWSLSVGPGIPGGLPVIADWLLTQPSSFSVGEHKESTFPVTEFWPTACEWGNVYSKNAKMGSPRPNPLSFTTLIHHGERKHLISWKDDPDAFPQWLSPGSWLHSLHQFSLAVPKVQIPKMKKIGHAFPWIELLSLPWGTWF